MDLQASFRRGTSKIKGSVGVKAKATSDPNQLLVTYNAFCRDSACYWIKNGIIAFANSTNSRSMLRSDNVVDPGWAYSKNTQEVEQKILKALMGETNKEINTVICSPFVFRYVVGFIRDNITEKSRKDLSEASTIDEIRAVLARSANKWFLNLMIEADEKGIKLHPSARRAWNVDIDGNGGFSIDGLNYLKDHATKAGRRQLVRIFPPARLLPSKDLK